MDPMGSTMMLLNMQLGERKLDFYGLRNSFSASVNLVESVILRRDHGSAQDLLSEEPMGRNQPSALDAPPVHVAALQTG